MIRSWAVERVKRNENGFRKNWDSRPTRRLYPWLVRQQTPAAVYAEREVHGVDDAGERERIVIWIERRPGGMWAVGRAVNPEYRSSNGPRREDYVFEGWDLDDALEQANAVLEDDVTVSEGDGMPEHVRPFVRNDLLRPLERWFFG